MESESKRQKYHETRRNLTPERKNNGRKRNSESHERYPENKKSRTEERNDKSSKRKRSGEGSRHDENRGKSKHYRSSSHDKSHLMKKGSEFDKRRNSRENNDDSGSETNERGKQNRGENSKSYESYYDSRTRERSLPKNHRPKQNSQSPTKSSESRNSPSKEAVHRQINDMLSTERHHTKYIDRSSSGEVMYIHWCPRFISPETKGHARGGKSLLHHKCRRCRKLCFHLLGKPGTFRSCLSCSGYNPRYIPDWYYHEVCRDCR